MKHYNHRIISKRLISLLLSVMMIMQTAAGDLGSISAYAGEVSGASGSTSGSGSDDAAGGKSGNESGDTSGEKSGDGSDDAKGDESESTSGSTQSGDTDTAGDGTGEDQDAAEGTGEDQDAIDGIDEEQDAADDVADETDSEDGESPELLGTDSITLYGTGYADGEEVKKDLTIQGGNAAEFDYGSDIVLSNEGIDSDSVSYSIWKSGDEESQKYVSDARLVPGVTYYIGYSYTPSDDSEKVKYDPGKEANRKFAIEIVPASLAAPENLHWDGTKAVWSQVDEDINGHGLKSGCDCSYTLTLYRENGGSRAEVCSITVDSSTDGVNVSGETWSIDLAEKIIGSGCGNYTFDVQTVPADTAAAVYYRASDASKASFDEDTDPVCAVKVNITAAAGIKEAGTAEDISVTDFLLIAGDNIDPEYGSAEIRAVPDTGEILSSADDWEFKTWAVSTGASSSQSITGVKFGDGSADAAKSSSTTLTLSSAYDGPASITMKHRLQRRINLI